MSDSNEQKPKKPRAVGRILSHLVSDLSILIGIAGVAAGVGMIYPPAGFIVAGAELIALGWLIAP